MAKSSPVKWKELVTESKNAYGVIIENTLEKFGEDTAEAKRQASDVLVPLLSEISNAIEQDHWVNILAKRLGLGMRPLGAKCQPGNKTAFLRRQLVPRNKKFHGKGRNLKPLFTGTGNSIQAGYAGKF